VAKGRGLGYTVARMKPRLSIVVPTWNRKDLALACLASLDAQCFQSAEVLLVDDASTDGTAEAVGGRFPAARIVRMAKNGGFARAVNAGIREAGGDLILLLNNDMTLAPEFLARLVDTADTSDAAFFAPLVLFQDEVNLVYSAGDAQSVSGRPESIGFRQRLDTFEHPGTIFGVSAGAALYRREVFDRAGLFDEWFGAYFEDADLSFRARLVGFRAQFVPGAVAYHIGSASIAGRTWWRTRQCCRNHLLLVLRNMPAPLLWRHRGAILRERGHQWRRLLSAARCEFGLLRSLGLAAGTGLSIVSALPHALSGRIGIQSGRVISTEELEALLTSPERSP